MESTRSRTGGISTMVLTKEAGENIPLKSGEHGLMLLKNH